MHIAAQARLTFFFQDFDIFQSHQDMIDADFGHLLIFPQMFLQMTDSNQIM